MSGTTKPTLSHVDQHGKANMVDVTDKSITSRSATAEAYITVSEQAFDQIMHNQMAKGDVFSVARIAGIQAAKQCSNLIPLCHPLMLSNVDIIFTATKTQEIQISCMCKLNGNTGVEMEALTGASVAALTMFDMCKAVDPEMVIHSLRVLEKNGGKTGLWKRKAI